MVQLTSALGGGGLGSLKGKHKTLTQNRALFMRLERVIRTQSKKGLTLPPLRREGAANCSEKGGGAYSRGRSQKKAEKTRTQKAKMSKERNSASQSPEQWKGTKKKSPAEGKGRSSIRISREKQTLRPHAHT